MPDSTPTDVLATDADGTRCGRLDAARPARLQAFGRKFPEAGPDVLTLGQRRQHLLTDGRDG